MSEILECIKLIKMYAWEKYFGQKLLGENNKIENCILYRIEIIKSSVVGKVIELFNIYIYIYSLERCINL